MASVRYRDVFKVMCCKLGLLRPAVTVRQTGRKELPLAFERLEPRQLMSRTTLGGSFSIADDFVGPREKFMPVQSYSYGPQRATVGSVDFAQMGPFLPSVYSPPSGRESGFLPPPTPPVFPQPPGTPPTPPPTSPPSGSGNKLKVDIWGVGINTPKIMEGDDFDVNVRWEGDHSSSPKNVTVNIWADIDFDDMIDDGEMYSTQTAMPNGFVRHRWKALDDGPWPGNTTPRDELKVVVGVDLDPTHESAHRTGALVHNVKPMFKEPPKYKFGVDKGRDYVEVEVDFWDPGVKDLFKLTLETSRSWTNHVNSYSSEWMAADSKGENTNYIKHRFYTERLDSLGERFTLTVADDDSGLDRRWNLWQAVERNDNDSNANSVVDLFERELPSADPEIVKLGGLWQVQPDWLHTDADLSVKHEESAPRHLMLSPDGVLRLFYDPSVIRIWDSPKKEKLFAPYMGLQGEIGHRFTGRETLWIEGYNRGSTEVYATWTPNTPGYFVNEYMNRLVSHSFTVNVAGIDVDIDSDNDEGVNPNFERDDWNEYLEDSPYALGKFVGNSNGASYVPFVVELFGISPNIKSLLSFGVKSIFEVIYLDRNNRSILLDMAYPSDIGITGDGSYTFWVRKKDNKLPLEKYIDSRQIPSNLTVGLFFDLRSHEESRVYDSVQIRPIMHSNADPIGVKDRFGEFPMALQADEAVRDAGASKDVYGDNETDAAKKFAVKRLTGEEIKTFTGIKDSVVLKYLTTKFKDGFFARMYLDHCDNLSTKAPRDGGGRYVIAFRGSEPKELEDWVTNFSQGLNGAGSQYVSALKLGNKLETHFEDKSHRSFTLSFTGHSLGGGLASAAVYSSGLKARTFIAAGINPDVFWGSTSSREADPDAPSFPKAYARYKEQQEQRKFTLIDAYQIVHDRNNVPCLLTWLQRTGVGAPVIRTWVADGRHIEQEGLYDFDSTWFGGSEYDTFDAMTKLLRTVFQEAESSQDFTLRVTALLRSTHWVTLFNVANVITKMGKSHMMPSVLYGLLHDDASNWNAYDHGPER